MVVAPKGIRQVVTATRRGQPRRLGPWLVIDSWAEMEMEAWEEQ